MAGSEERREKDFFAMRGVVVVRPRYFTRAPRVEAHAVTTVTDRWTQNTFGPTRPRVGAATGAGEGRYLFGNGSGWAVGWGGRSPPGAADMALIFSGAAWHGCMTTMTCIIHPSYACPLKLRFAPPFGS